MDEKSSPPPGRPAVEEVPLTLVFRLGFRKPRHSPEFLESAIKAAIGEVLDELGYPAEQIISGLPS